MARCDRDRVNGGAGRDRDRSGVRNDASDRPTQITDFNSAGAVLASFVYSYTADNVVVSETNDGVLRTFAYDADSELVNDGGTAYSYDANGNRDSTGYVVGTNNQVTTDGTSTFTYDAAGNLIQSTVGASGATWVYTYNNMNEMVGASYSATLGGTVTTQVTLVYDAYGNTIEDDTWVSGVGATVVRYGLDGWNPSEAGALGNSAFNDWVDLSGSNVLVDRRLFGPGVAQPVLREDASGNVGWYLADELGNVRALVNGSGTVLTALTYDGWGNVLSNSTPSQSDRDQKAGSQWDGTLGNWRSADRTQNADGSWNQQDEKGFTAGDPNLHRVCGNDPVNATDPSGLGYDEDLVSGDLFQALGIQPGQGQGAQPQQPPPGPNALVAPGNPNNVANQNPAAPAAMGQPGGGAFNQFGAPPPGMANVAGVGGGIIPPIPAPLLFDPDVLGHIGGMVGAGLSAGAAIPGALLLVNVPVVGLPLAVVHTAMSAYTGYENGRLWTLTTLYPNGINGNRITPLNENLWNWGQYPLQFSNAVFDVFANPFSQVSVHNRLNASAVLFAANLKESPYFKDTLKAVTDHFNKVGEQVDAHDKNPNIALFPEAVTFSALFKKIGNSFNDFKRTHPQPQSTYEDAIFAGSEPHPERGPAPHLAIHSHVRLQRRSCGDDW